MFYFSRHCHNFQYFVQYFDICWKKYNLALCLVEIERDTNPDPDQQVLDAPDPDTPK
jgi:hypothetical protein